MRRLRTAKGASEYLTEKGLTIAESTLGKYRVIGGGPRFRKWGRAPVYDEADLDSWAEERLGVHRRSTSEVFRQGTVQAEPLTNIALTIATDQGSSAGPKLKSRFRLRDITPGTAPARRRSAQAAQGKLKKKNMVQRSSKQTSSARRITE